MRQREENTPKLETASEMASVPLCVKEMHVVREEVVSSGNGRCYMPESLVFKRLGIGKRSSCVIHSFYHTN